MQEWLDTLVKTAVEQCRTAEEWWQRRGEILALRTVLALEPAEKEQVEYFDELVFNDEVTEDGNPLED